MQIDQSKCMECGNCVALCNNDAIQFFVGSGYVVNQNRCQGCGECTVACPAEAIG